MDVPQIKDREHLEAWLKTRSREECVAIAHRAAMRVAPIFWSRRDKEPAKWRDFADLAVLRALLISAVAGKEPNADLINFAENAANTMQSAFASFDLGIESTTDYGEAASYAVSAIYADSGPYSASVAADILAESYTGDLNWDEISLDVKALESGRKLLKIQFWSNHNIELTQYWTATKERWKIDKADWTFWIRWYEAALHGKPLNWELQRDIALLPSEVWKGNLAELAAAIAVIELKYAIDATQNGEIVAINPQSGKLFLAPDTELPADIATYANRKLAKAIALFGESPANQYTALAPELKLLADTLADASNLPVEIFDACASVSRRIDARVASGECPHPDKDALLDDFLTRVRDTGSDILGNDKTSQKVLFKRHGIRGNSSLIEGRAFVLAGAGLISAGSEGYLARTILVNAEQATDASGNAEERDIASVKFAGRIARAFGALSKAGAGLVASEKAVEALDKIRLSQTANQLYKIALKYLGY